MFDIVAMAKRRVKMATKKRAKRLGSLRLDMSSNLRLAYPANNLPTSVSDKDIREAVRSFNAAHFRKSAI